MLMSGKLKVLQINVNRSHSTTEHVLQLIIELNVSILAIQKPWEIGSGAEGFRSDKQVLPQITTPLGLELVSTT